MGSVTSVLSSTGEVLERRTYDAFGQLTCMLPDGTPVATSPTGLKVGFHGQLLDQFTGMYQMGYRWYSPVLGRWVSRDPIGFAGGLNHFVAGGNHLIVNNDVFGLDWQQGFVDALPTWAVERIASMPYLPQGLVDFSSGMGDSLSIGLTNVIRESMGTKHLVGKCSKSYKAGGCTGTSLSLAMGVAGGVQAAGVRGAGVEFSHWIPNRFGGPRSIWNGNYVPFIRHYLHDSYRYPAGWKNMGTRYGLLQAQIDRIPNTIKGTLLGAGYGLSGQSIVRCECE